MRVCFDVFSDRQVLVYIREELIYTHKVSKQGDLIKRLDGIIAKTSHNTSDTMGRN